MKGSLLYLSLVALLALGLGTYATLHYRKAWLTHYDDWSQRDAFLREPMKDRYPFLHPVVEESRARVNEGVWGPAFMSAIVNSRPYQIITLGDTNILIAGVVVLCVSLYFLKQAWTDHCENERLAKQTAALAESMTQRNQLLSDWRNEDLGRSGVARKFRHKQINQQSSGGASARVDGAAAAAVQVLLSQTKSSAPAVPSAPVLQQQHSIAQH